MHKVVLLGRLRFKIKEDSQLQAKRKREPQRLSAYFNLLEKAIVDWLPWQSLIAFGFMPPLSQTRLRDYDGSISLPFLKQCFRRGGGI